MDRIRTDSTHSPRIKLAVAAGLCFFLVAVCVLLVRLSAQQQTSPSNQTNLPSLSNKGPHTPFDDMPSPTPGMADRQVRALNAMRQKSMVSDTEKLLKLAQELNNELESSNSSALTPVQLRKIADIEKLARNVKQKMSISYSGAPSFDEPIAR